MSKKKLLLVGAGGFGRMVAEQAMLQYDCAFVDDGQDVDTEICGIPVVGGIADLPELRKDYDLLVVGIGSNCTICNHATVPDGADIPDCTAVH